MIELPNKKKCYNLPEQVAQNLSNIQYLAEQYKNIDALPTIWQTYKEEFDSELETFEGWERTFGGWETTLETYLASMSSAAVGAIAGQNITPAGVAASGPITSPSIIETMAAGYTMSQQTVSNLTLEAVYGGIVKNGNKLTIAYAFNITRTGTYNYSTICAIVLPVEIGSKIFVNVGSATVGRIKAYAVDTVGSSDTELVLNFAKNSNASFSITGMEASVNNLTLNNKYYARFEITILLSDNLLA